MIFSYKNLKYKTSNDNFRFCVISALWELKNLLFNNGIIIIMENLICWSFLNSRCECKPDYVDVTNSVIDGSTLVNLPGQVCVANPTDHCVRTNWRFQRNGYLVVRRRMPAVDAFTLCFAIQLNSQRLRGTLTTYRQGNSVLLMRTDDGGNLKVSFDN